MEFDRQGELVAATTDASGVSVLRYDELYAASGMSCSRNSELRAASVTDRSK